MTLKKQYDPNTPPTFNRGDLIQTIGGVAIVTSIEFMEQGSGWCCWFLLLNDSADNGMDRCDKIAPLSAPALALFRAVVTNLNS